MTHWLVVVSSVHNFHWLPEAANVLGWFVAFFVSFGGHYRLTFRHQHKQFYRALRRFFLVSASGFFLNELAYIWLLHHTAMTFDVLLGMILVAIAGITFVVSRLWAFRHKHEPA